jgi:DNA-binding NarL/FixJ family response regulator
VQDDQFEEEHPADRADDGGDRAVPWAERAETELRATGETARKRDASAVEQPTPQELQIAGLVAQGLTNKEIAAQLFLSPRTVDCRASLGGCRRTGHGR